MEGKSGTSTIGTVAWCVVLLDGLLVEECAMTIARSLKSAIFIRSSLFFLDHLGIPQYRL